MIVRDELSTWQPEDCLQSFVKASSTRSSALLPTDLILNPTAVCSFPSLFVNCSCRFLSLLTNIMEDLIKAGNFHLGMFRLKLLFRQKKPLDLQSIVQACDSEFFAEKVQLSKLHCRQANVIYSASIKTLDNLGDLSITQMTITPDFFW